MVIISDLAIAVVSVQGSELSAEVQEAMDSYKVTEAAYMAALEEQQLPSAAQQQALRMVAAAFDRACQALVREHRALLDAAAENNRVQLNRCTDTCCSCCLLSHAACGYQR